MRYALTTVSYLMVFVVVVGGLVFVCVGGVCIWGGGGVRLCVVWGGSDLTR